MYEWVKAAHIISVIAWMAALLYLPRLMVYHADTEAGSQQSETFKIMEKRLLRAIMTPSMIAAWIFGLWLMHLTGAWLSGWFHAKLLLVVLLSAFHGFCAVWVKEFSRDERKRKPRFFRFINELPAVIMVGVVVLAVVKPF
jgi:protoporphyrinogen IX oxidase